MLLFQVIFKQKLVKMDKKGFFMKILLNGEAQDISATNVADLIAELGLETRMLAVERNLEVVSKSAYAATVLEENDKIEIVHMIGGG